MSEELRAKAEADKAELIKSLEQAFEMIDKLVLLYVMSPNVLKELLPARDTLDRMKGEV